MKVYPLKGKIQTYDWGGNEFIAELLGVDNTGKKPMAEYWMGAHDNAPAIIETGHEPVPLNEFIQQHASAILGEPIRKSFGRLPFLFKVLDVKDMLSIQVHPSKEAAVRAFAQENAAGVPLNAPHRNYKDDNHKPELMVALSDFWLLHGFKPVADLQAVLQRTTCLQFLLPVFGNGNYQALYRKVMEMDDAAVKQVFDAHLKEIMPLYEAGKLNRSQEDFWAARAVKTFCKDGKLDKGLFSIYFFNIVHLKEGEAIFQGAGMPHAYLEGQNMEIMANSDNVLRGGLTPKHVDVPELLKHTLFEPTVPNILKGSFHNGELIFKTPAADFELRKIELAKAQTLTITTNGPSIFFVEKGQGYADTLQMQKGEAAFVGAHTTIDFKAEEDWSVFYATTP